MTTPILEIRDVVTAPGFLSPTRAMGIADAGSLR